MKQMQYHRKKKDFWIGSYGQKNSHYISIRCTPDNLGPGSFAPNWFLSKPSISTSFSTSDRCLINTAPSTPLSIFANQTILSASNASDKNHILKFNH
jgi:hypothetical protein